jgi:hypothetical protein
MTRTKKTIAALAVGAAALTGTGVAYAYFTTSGSGTGSATTGTSSAVTVNQTSTTGVLRPGSSAPLSGTFDNAGTSAQYVTSVTAGVRTFTVRPDTSKPACTQGDFTITGTSNVPGDIAAGTSKGTWSGLTLTMTNSTANQDNCKNLTASQLVLDYVAS